MNREPLEFDENIVFFLNNCKVEIRIIDENYSGTINVNNVLMQKPDWAKYVIIRNSMNIGWI